MSEDAKLKGKALQKSMKDFKASYFKDKDLKPMYVKRKYDRPSDFKTIHGVGYTASVMRQSFTSKID